jgi:hypothetical protein
MTSRRLVCGGCGTAIVMACLPMAALFAQNTSVDPWVTRTNHVRFQPLRAMDTPLQLDVPKKDWMVLPSSGSLLLALATRKGDAVVLVEYAELRLALVSDDITEVFAQLEVDAITNHQPNASAFESRVLAIGARRLIAVEYTRLGVLGNERVRQYSVPVGNKLYRIACISSTPRFAHYDAVFSHMAASFAPAG